MPSITFQAPVGLTPVQASSIAALTVGSSLCIPYYGLRISVPSANTGKIYWGASATVSITTGCLIPPASEITVNPAEFNSSVNGKPDLTTLYFVSDTAVQTITGAAVF